MRSFDVDQANLKTFISAAQGEPIVLTQSGAPIAIIERVDGMYQEQIEFGASLDFLSMIQARRNGPTISQDELARRLAAADEN